MCQMVGILSMVFIRRKWVKQVQDIKFYRMGVGFMGVGHTRTIYRAELVTIKFLLLSAHYVLGVTGHNKGGVGIWFTVKRTRFLFFNCHLESGLHAVSKRNANMELLESASVYIESSRPSVIRT